MPSTLAERIATARKHANLSQGVLAQAVGVSRPAVSQWESPTGTAPTSDNLKAVAFITNAPLTWLLDDASDAVATWDPPAHPARRARTWMDRNQRVGEQSGRYVARSAPAGPALPASQSPQLDDDKLERSIQFLERQFATLEREFIASRNADLIAGVYSRIGRRGETNLIALSQWLNQQLENEGRTNVGTGGIRSTG